MSEIEKMYENAGFETEIVPCYSLNCEYFEVDKGYPPFTAEKQIELLCFLINFGVEIIMQKCDIPIKTENIANNLAGITNEIWQDLTEEEKQQIKEILK